MSPVFRHAKHLANQIDVQFSQWQHYLQINFKGGIHSSPMKKDTILLLTISLAIVWSGSLDAQTNFTLTTLVSFNFTNGAHPVALILGTNGTIYGTTATGGSNTSQGGTLFQLNSNNTLKMLASFRSTNGINPGRGLYFAHDGSLLGTAASGGVGVASAVFGTLFQLQTNGVINALTTFNGTNGSYPLPAMVAGRDGDLYGVAEQGGIGFIAGQGQAPNANGDGLIFRVAINTAGNYSGISTYASFNSTNGANPNGGLILGKDNNFYGTTLKGGTNSLPVGAFGTLFKMAPDGTLTSIISFNGVNGGGPSATLLSGQDGNIYGTTSFGGLGVNFNLGSGFGTVFQLTTNGVFNTVGYFNRTNGSAPLGLAWGPDGMIYGTATGPFTNATGYGSVFQMTTNGVIHSLATFNNTNGSLPNEGLLMVNGNFYGTTVNGGTNGLPTGYGTIFRLSMTPALSAFQTNGALSFVWNAMPGQIFQLQYTTNLNQKAWVNLGALITASNSSVTTSDAMPVGTPPRFYRVAVVP